MHVANFTPDTIEWQHIGEIGRLEPGDITEFSDSRGKHILNKWGARGLLRVTYGDKDMEDEKRKEAMRIYKRFWERQIITFNRHNETLENENKAYVFPPNHITEKAEEFGLPLKGPWTIQKQPDSKEMDTLKSEMDELKKMMSQLTTMTQDVTKQRDEARIEQFTDLDREDFRDWMELNIARVRQWPEGIQALVQAKWEATQGSELYPLAA